VSNSHASTAQGELLTAEDYLRRYEPGVLHLIDGDVKAALREDTARAEAIAINAGQPTNEEGRYPEVVWLCVYR
jgi:hypothetical protein